MAKESMDNQWLYIDFNSYFASVEQQLNPQLRGKPVAVMPVASESTCAIAASYEAKAFGIKTGTPIWEAKKKCPHLLCVKADHEKYLEFHEKILREIDTHVPIARVCSIDEVACHLMENERKNAAVLAEKIKQGLKKNVGKYLKCSIGIAPNCYLAKVAADMKKPDGLTFICSEDLPKILYSLKLCDLPGIGANMELRLRKQGIFDMEKFCSLDLEQMRKRWGSVEGERMWHHINGFDLPFKETKQKTLGHSQVMAPELRDPNQAREVGRRLTAKAASRLRRIDLVASRMSVFINLERGDFFEETVKCECVSDSLTFLSLFEKMWEQIMKRSGLSRVKKISVVFSSLEKQERQQFEFFIDPSKQKRERVSHVLDQINQKYGKDSVSLGTFSSQSRSSLETKITFTRIPNEEEFSE